MKGKHRFMLRPFKNKTCAVVFLLIFQIKKPSNFHFALHNSVFTMLNDIDMSLHILTKATALTMRNRAHTHRIVKRKNENDECHLFSIISRFYPL